MKVLLVICLILLSFQGHSKSIHSFSFNVHCTFNDWKSRIDYVARHLAKIQPDFIAFQEVCRDKDNEMMDFIISRLKHHGYAVKSHDNQFSHMAWDKFEEHLMIVSRHAAEGVDKGYLPMSPLQRSYLAFKIKGVWLVNTHLEFKDEYAHFREEQVNFLMNRFRKDPHIMMGDFNSEPNSPEQAMLVRNNYFHFFPGPTYPSNDPKYFLDGFWISPELRSIYLRAQTVFKGGVFLSDHLAVELIWQGNL